MTVKATAIKFYVNAEENLRQHHWIISFVSD